MPVTRKPTLTLAVGLSLGAFSPPGAEAPFFLDPQHPPSLVEGADVFECPDIRAAVRYRQERREPDSVPRLEDSLRVMLLELTVSDATLPAEQLASAGEVFRSFAWVREVSATCYRGTRTMTIDVRGMPHRLFFDALRDDGPPPVLRTSTIRLSASGVEHISQFDPLDAPARSAGD